VGSRWIANCLAIVWVACLAGLFVSACQGLGSSGDAGSDGLADGQVDGTSDGDASEGDGLGDDGASGPWRSALYPEDWTPELTDAEGRFLHDFSYAGYHLGEEEPPSLPPGIEISVADEGADASGETDSTAAFQAAMDAVGLAGGGRVFVPAGLYRVDGLLVVSHSGVVVKGEGAEVSRVFFTRDGDMTGRASLSFRGASSVDLELPLIEDAEPRAFELLVSEASGLAVDDDVEVGALISDEFVAEHGMTGVWQTSVGQWRAFFRRRVAAVDCGAESCSVRLNVPLRYPLKTRDAASLRRVTGLLAEVGVEDLGLSNAVSQDGAFACDRAHVLGLIQVKDAWMRRVASFASPVAEGNFHLQSGGVLVQQSKRVSLTDSVFELAQNRNGGGNGYLFEIMQSSEVLVRDCRGLFGRHNFIQNWDFGTSGCVFLRVLSQGGVVVTPYGSLTGLCEYHHSLAMANLVDSVQSDDGWGAVNRRQESSGAGHTATQNVFWNIQGGLLRSYQYGWGYVIGSRDALVYVDPADDLMSQLNGQAEGTEPLDWLEGLDRGAELEPTSLYEDQLRRRLEAL